MMICYNVITNINDTTHVENLSIYLVWINGQTTFQLHIPTHLLTNIFQTDNYNRYLAIRCVKLQSSRPKILVEKKNF